MAGEPPPEFVGLLIALQFCKQVKVFGYEPPKSLENESGLSGIWDKDAAEAEQAAAEGPDAEKELSLQKAQQNRDLPYFRVYKGPDEIYDLHAGSESKAEERMEAGISSTHIESAIIPGALKMAMDIRYDDLGPSKARKIGQISPVSSVGRAQDSHIEYRRI